jgi:hypothetical protein
MIWKRWFAIILSSHYTHQVKEEFSMSEIRPHTEKDLNGPTGFSFDGTVTLSMNGTNVAVPVSAVGQVDWDGKGKAPSATRTFNFGGAVILKQIAKNTGESGWHGNSQVRGDHSGSDRNPAPGNATAWNCNRDFRVCPDSTGKRTPVHWNWLVG